MKSMITFQNQRLFFVLSVLELLRLKYLKKNRSNKYTTGLVITNNTNNNRFLFFELDNPFNQEDYDKVFGIYQSFGLDVLCHRTGNGLHFLSPTLIDVETWKEAMKELKEINKKCPMTTLRWWPNKHNFEDKIWISATFWSDPNNIRRNSNELSTLLNKTFKTDFIGTVTTDLKFVRYPLP